MRALWTIRFTSVMHWDPDDWFPYSVTLAIALLLLMIGLLAISSMVVRTGPFH